MGNDAQIQDRVILNTVRLTRLREDPQGGLRNFDAAIEATTEVGDDSTVIGGISGYLSWSAWLPDLAANHSSPVSFAEVIAAAIEIGATMPTEPGSKMQAALIITNFWLEPHWRGHRLSRRIVDQLIDLLLFTPETTLVLAYLEPQSNPTGRAHHQTAHTLQDAYTQAGFEQWRRSNAWWIRPDSLAW